MVLRIIQGAERKLKILNDYYDDAVDINAPLHLGEQYLKGSATDANGIT
jgi:hypothetical protein